MTAILMPAVAIATVGTWGLTVWIYKAINGPPGPSQEMSGAMADKPPMSHVARRDFLNGRWPARTKSKERTTTQKTSTLAEIASILVQVRPEQLDVVARAIEALPRLEIYSRSPQGKLVVVIETDNVGDIGAAINAISSTPYVLTAALVFHATDESRIL